MEKRKRKGYREGLGRGGKKRKEKKRKAEKRREEKRREEKRREEKRREEEKGKKVKHKTKQKNKRRKERKERLRTKRKEEERRGKRKEEKSIKIISPTLILSFIPLDKSLSLKIPHNIKKNKKTKKMENTKDALEKSEKIKKKIKTWLLVTSSNPRNHHFSSCQSRTHQPLTKVGTSFVIQRLHSVRHFQSFQNQKKERRRKEDKTKKVENPKRQKKMFKDGRAGFQTVGRACKRYNVKNCLFIICQSISGSFLFSNFID